MAETGPRELADTLAPLAQLLLIAQMVGLLLLSLAADRAVVPLLLIAAMVGTAAIPVLRWRQVGPVLVRSPLALVPALVLATAGAADGVPDVLGVAYAVSVATFVGVLHGSRAGVGLVALPALAFVLPGSLRSAAFLTEDLLACGAILGAALAGARLRDLVLGVHTARRDAAARTVALVAAEQRAHVARELHDTLAKTIEGVAMIAGQLTPADETNQRLLDHLRTGLDRARGEARAVLHGLRAQEDERPLPASLEGLCTSFGRVADVTTLVDIADDLPDLPAEVRYEVLQVVREALRNAQAHAGASTVTVTAGVEQDTLCLTVADDGRGMARERPGHFGLQGMRERAALLGGDLEIESSRPHGTTVRLLVPSRPVTR